MATDYAGHDATRLPQADDLRMMRATEQQHANGAITPNAALIAEITELKRSRDSFSGMWKRAALENTTLEDENAALAAQVEHTKQKRDQLQEIAQNQAVGLMDAEIARITLEAQVERKLAEAKAEVKRITDMLSDSATVHANIMRGTIKISKANLIHAAGLPANIEEQLAEAKEAEIEARHELQSVLPKECCAEEIISLKEFLAEARKNTWQEITPENLPRKGDEVGYWSKSGEFAVCLIWNSKNLTYKQWKYQGWKYLRSINPPAQPEPKP